MAVMRVLVADDEPNAREGLASLLSDDPELHVVAVCASGTEAADAIVRTRPDIALLDIHMPGRDGLDVLAHVCRGRVTAVILVTAYSEHALSAFEAQALDYLLKPFSDVRFADAIVRAKQRVREHRLSHDAPEHLERVLASIGARRVVVRMDEVDWIEGADYYAKLHVRGSGRAYLVRQSLRALAAKLDPARFARVHRSAIVSLERVRQLRCGDEGEHVLVLRDGTRVPVSRRRVRELERLLGQPA